MSIGLIFMRWVAPFVVGLCLTGVAALIGAFPFVLAALGTLLKDGPSFVAIDLLETSLGFGALLAAPGTLVLGPLFYVLGGSRLSGGVFVLICGVFGFTLVEALVVAVQIMDRHAYFTSTNYINLPLVGGVAGLITGLIFRVVMMAVEARFLPAGTANVQE